MKHVAESGEFTGIAIIFIECIFSSGKRITLMKRGQLDIVQMLRALPKTVHHSKSFNVDCLYSSVSVCRDIKYLQN